MNQFLVERARLLAGGLGASALVLSCWGAFAPSGGLGWFVAALVPQALALIVVVRAGVEAFIENYALLRIFMAAASSTAGLAFLAFLAAGAVPVLLCLALAAGFGTLSVLCTANVKLIR